jgi:hypothetical protein
MGGTLFLLDHGAVRLAQRITRDLFLLRLTCRCMLLMSLDCLTNPASGRSRYSVHRLAGLLAKALQRVARCTE